MTVIGALDGGELRGHVGVLGDVHAEDDVLASALAIMRTNSIDHILCVGDIADGRGDLERACRLLKDAGVHCVMGNHDRWALGDEMRQLPEISELGPAGRGFLSGLPPMRRYATSRGGLLLCHGLGHDDMIDIKLDTPSDVLETFEVLSELRRNPELGLVVSGHTHAAGVRDLGDLLLVNAGTLRARPGRPSTFLVLDLDAWPGLDQRPHRWIEAWTLGSDGNWGSGPIEAVPTNGPG
jgi:predicted phosphodiesterase